MWLKRLEPRCLVSFVILFFASGLMIVLRKASIGLTRHLRILLSSLPLFTEMSVQILRCVLHYVLSAQTGTEMLA